jgi:hypothetical protein
MELLPMNKEVNVSAFYFASSANLRAFPKQIELDNEPVTFKNSGLQYLVRKGQQLVRLFDMSDGENTYRLRLENDNWTLVGMKAGA